jgi:hypothetical protein
MRKLAAAASLAALCFGLAYVPAPDAGTAVAGKAGIAEFLSGDIRLDEISGVSGVVVGPDCRLTVRGDVDAGETFVSRGGEIRIYGSLYAGAVWLDSEDGGLRAELGSVVARYYTQCGGNVKVRGSIVTRADEDYDGLGLVNVSCDYAGNGGTSLSAGGGVFARGGEIYIGDAPPMDEAERVSFVSERGRSAGGYEDTPSGIGEPEVYAGEGMVSYG